MQWNSGPELQYTSGKIVGPGGKCLDIAGDVQKAGTHVQLYQCNGTSAQQWKVSGENIVSTSGLCLDVTGDVSTNGTQIELWQCNGGPNQKWSFKGAEPVDAGVERDAATPSRDAAAPPSSTAKVLWKAGDALLGKWITSNTFQCGNPVQDGSSFTFNLKYAANGSCGRNQASPIDANTGESDRLPDGHQATFRFHYIDGTPSGAAPGMGYDKDARSLILQIHPYGGGNPCTSLNFDNGGYVGNPQVWHIDNCSGPIWTGKYTPGEVDDWQINVVVSQTSAGHIKAWRNGQLVVDVAGATYDNTGGGAGDPWWNMGPYKSRWEESTGPCCSTLTEVNATIDNMIVTEDDPVVP